ncbi:MAG: GumC family protein, partial [Gemmatimonadaceae bacterium]
MADIVPLSMRVEGPGTQLSMPGYARPIGASGAPSSRGIQGILLRHIWLIAGCIAVLVFIGAVLTWRLTPIYSAAASMRIDEQPSNVQALDVLASLKGTEINTEIEVLGSRTLARAVVDSLGLQLQLTGPRGVLRSQVFPYVQPVRSQRPNTPVPHVGLVGKLAARFKGLLPNSGGYRLDRRPDGRYALTNLDTKGQLGVVSPGDSLSLEGMRFVFAPAAGDALDHYNFSVLPTDIAVNTTQGAINVSRPMPLANLAVIGYEDPDAELARDVPNELTALYLAQRHAVGREGNESTVKFLQEQIKQLSTSLSVQEDSLRRFRESHQAVSLQDEATTGVQRLGDLRADRNKMQAERSALGVLLKNIQTPADSNTASSASRYRYLMAFPTLLQNQAASGLLQSLNEAEDKRTALITKRTPADPEVQAIDARISALETQINGIASTYYRGLSDQVAGMDTAIAQSQARLNTLPGKEVEENR